MRPWFGLLLLISVLALPLERASAQLAGEDLPPGVTGEDVYRVTSQMYCDVCEGVPVSDCPSVTCRAWRQEVANLLGEGYSDDQVFAQFAELYGNEISGLPLRQEDRNFALLLPILAVLGMAALVGFQVWRITQGQQSRAQQAAAQAGVRPDYARPVPDNVDPHYLEDFLALVEDRR
ncbi:MAG: hypothetical protein HC915_10360 [Anaerolineae bacterium]|nr:hypothetical protein [Anaerolineae bacterium]